VEHYVRRRARTPVRSLPQSGKFSGSSDVASRNRLQRFLATNATNALPPDAWNPAQPHPDALTSYPTSGACYLELRRISLLGTWVNKGKRKGRGCYYASALLFASELLSLLWGNPLGRPPQFRARRHNPGIGQDERESTAVGGDEQIDLRTTCSGDGACAIRLDLIRAGGVLLRNNLPVKVSRNDGVHLTIAVKHVIACHGEWALLLPRDVNPIKGEQICPAETANRRTAELEEVAEFRRIVHSGKRPSSSPREDSL
jgi:hypothetical protein